MAFDSSTIPIRRITTAAYTIPTEAPESDGTLAWDSTTLVLVRIEGGGKTGIGYSYADTATAALVRDKLAPLLETRDALAIRALAGDGSGDPQPGPARHLLDGDFRRR